MLTPSNIVRTNPDRPPMLCQDCAKPLSMQVRYPNPPEHRCTTRGCPSNAFPEGPVKVPGFSTQGWI